MGTEIIKLKNILPAEDDPRDVELTLAALEQRRLQKENCSSSGQRGSSRTPLVTLSDLF